MCPNPKSPGLIEERWFEAVHVVLLQRVLAVVEERELVVDLRDPRVLTVVLTLSYLVNLLLKLLQAWVNGIYHGEKVDAECGGETILMRF